MTGLEGTAGLVRLILRRDRVRLPIWIVAIIGLTYVSGNAMGSTFATQRSIDAYADSAGLSPAAIAFSGPPIALHTLGGLVLNKVAIISVMGIVLLVVFEMVRHTRAEEEEGRTELLRSAVVGRHAGAAAALIVTVLASTVVGLGIAGALAAASVPTSGAVLYGVSTAVLGWVFAAVTLCLAQVTVHARSSLGMALAVLGVAYVLRATGDVKGNALVWLSPVGWSQATHPLGDERWWPLLVSLVATVLLVALAVVLANRRDVGAGLFVGRAGPARASRMLRGPVGLALRLQRGVLVGWAAGVFLLAAVYGSLTNAVQDMAHDNRTLEDYFQSSGGGSLVDGFLATILLILALLSAGFAVSSAMRLRTEESSGRVEILLATGLSRSRWMLGSLAVTLVGSLVVLTAGGLGLGLAYGAVASDAGEVLRLTRLELVYAPAVLATATLTVLLFGWLPRVVSVAWGFLALCFVLGWLGSLLNPPDWLAAVSPFEHVPQVPVEALTVTAPAVIALSVVLLTALGLLGFRRRDVQ